jgi:MrcB-like, N-terminal domain/Protein NO VEIN, C-terminal
MGMDTLLSDVLVSNMFWNSTNTPEMQTRSQLIRKEIPDWLRARSAGLVAASSIAADDLAIEGSDGVGQKTELPWVRVFSRYRSPRATEGWYLVYLFSALGDRVYLSVNQGTTVWTGDTFRPKPRADLEMRVSWARDVLGVPDRVTELVREISLEARRTNLGPAYESGNVFALEYRADAIPSPVELERDLLYMAELLGSLYRFYDRAAYVPGDVAPEVIEATTAAERAAGLRAGRRGGQGFGLTLAQRDAVELYAIRKAQLYLGAMGWDTKYVGESMTWDIEASNDEKKIFVEVKGSTSPGETVILTAAQVVKYREKYPNTALIVVSDIDLDRSAPRPVPSGGTLTETNPWLIDDRDLKVISWTYRTGL